MKHLIPKVSLIFLASFILFGCENQLVSISDVKTCLQESVVKNLCGIEKTVFRKDAPEIFVTAKMQNASEGAEITFVWTYMSENLEIDRVSAVSKNNGSVKIYSSLPKPEFEEGWPIGDYEIIISISDNSFEPVIKTFRVM